MKTTSIIYQGDCIERLRQLPDDSVHQLPINGMIVPPRIARKPSKMTLAYLAGAMCNAGEPIPCTVLDCFSGSGTTGVVAARLGRNYIGIELNPEYVEISRRRLSAAMQIFNTVEVIV